MKTFAVLAVSIVLMSGLFCPMVMAFPALPADLQMVQPDPSLPKEISAFWGKYEWIDATWGEWCIIVERIDEEKASLYIWQSGLAFRLMEVFEGWERVEAKVIKEYGEYKLWYYFKHGRVMLNLKGEHLILWFPQVLVPLRRVL